MFNLLATILAAVALTEAKFQQSQLGNESRIVGGLNAKEGQFPFTASLRIYAIKHHFCGASIINEHFLLTAAHCVARFIHEPKKVTVYIGSIYLNGSGTYHNVEKFTVHPDFYSFTHGRNSTGTSTANKRYKPFLANDVALVKLASPITYSDHVQPINLPINHTVNVGDKAIVIGWGNVEYPGRPNYNRLQYLKTSIADMERCVKEHHDASDRQICIAGDVGHGACIGDSGGPVIYEKDNKRYIIGMVSYGTPCGKGITDVCSRVTHYLPWILEQLQK